MSRILRRAVTATAAMGAVVGSWQLARAGHGGNPLDALADVVRTPRGSNVDWVVAATTDIGSVFGLAGMAAAVTTGMSRRTGVEVLGAGAAGWIVGQAAKPLMERQRPYETGLAPLLVHPPAGSSWPSGHTAVAAATATVLAPLGPATAAVGTTLAGWVGLTRIYVGAHHPSDVLGGIGLGVLSGLAWQAILDGVDARRAGA